jgi:hypothetical protein
MAASSALENQPASTLRPNATINKAEPTTTRLGQDLLLTVSIWQESFKVSGQYHCGSALTTV